MHNGLEDPRELADIGEKMEIQNINTFIFTGLYPQ